MTRDVLVFKPKSEFDAACFCAIDWMLKDMAKHDGKLLVGPLSEYSFGDYGPADAPPCHRFVFEYGVEQ